MTSIPLTWTELKAHISSISRLRFIDRNEFYLIYYFDDIDRFETSIMKDSGTDQTDFENNYKNLANKPYEFPVDADGASLARPKLAPLGWTFQYHCLHFHTSELGSMHHKDISNNDINCTAMKFYELVNNEEVEITGDDLNQTYLDSNCVKTTVTWEPAWDFELMGAKIRACDPVNGENYLYCWVQAAPDIPAQYGGSKTLISNLNFRCVSDREPVVIDGRASKHISYNATYHTGKFVVVLRHTAGLQIGIQLEIELFKA
jgi:hypothetical protein